MFSLNTCCTPTPDLTALGKLAAVIVASLVVLVAVSPLISVGARIVA